MKKLLRFVVMGVVFAGTATAQDDPLKLAVPDALDASGFAQFLVPRFSLKTSIRIERVGPDEASQMQFVAGGDDVVFVGLGTQWGFDHNGDPRATRFLDWMRSDVGKRTIESFSGAGGEVFSSDIVVEKQDDVAVYEGDAARGEEVSLAMCGRCHVINKKNRMNGMGSTPSFAVLRGLPNWDTRFATFHLLNPHPSFTQIADVTEPFDPTLPPPIVPLEMTLDDLEAIMAYVSKIEAADLGAPIQFQ